jgi:hypothetical protein
VCDFSEVVHRFLCLNCSWIVVVVGSSSGGKTQSGGYQINHRHEQTNSYGEALRGVYQGKKEDWCLHIVEERHCMCIREALPMCKSEL